MTPKRIFLRCCLALFVVLLWQVPVMAAHAAGAAVTTNPSSPTCAIVGKTATANGSGYTTGQTVQVYIDQTPVQPTTTVRSDGTWSVTFTVPDKVGTWPLYGIGSPDRASTSFCIKRDTLLPTAPSGVKNVNYGAYNFRITWTDNSDNETGFEVYNGNEIRNVSASTGKGSTVQYMWPAQPNQYMCIAVRAKNSAGYSAWAGMWTCTTTPASGPPAAPTNALATAISSSQIRITWTDNANNETDYQIFNGDGTRYLGKDVGGSGTTGSYTWSGLAPGTYMCFRVRAYNEWGTSVWAPSNTYTCATTPR